MQLQVEIIDEINRNCKQSPKKVASTGSNLKQTTPTSRGDQYGEKSRPGLAAKDAEQSYEVGQRGGNASLQEGSSTGESFMARCGANNCKGSHHECTESTA